jgi:hypothetical protein
MQASLSKKWHALSSGTPGRRFKDRYHRSHRGSKKSNVLARVIRFSIAGVAAAIGVLLTVIPGPAIPFYFLAGALVATDWLWMAKVLDWVELRMRRVFTRIRRLWNRLPTAGKVALAIAGGCLSLASTYLTYRLFA